MTAAIFSFVVGISLGMGLGVYGTLYLLRRAGVFKSFDINESVSRMSIDDFKVGGSE